jgi:hypothetical protein
MAEIKRLRQYRQGGSNLQDEFSTNSEFLDFLGGSPIQKVNKMRQYILAEL